jgi:hypothetical protein
MRTVGFREENIPALYRRAAYFLDRILKGAKPLINAGVCPHGGSLRGPVAVGFTAHSPPDQRRPHRGCGPVTSDARRPMAEVAEEGKDDAEP